MQINQSELKSLLYYDPEAGYFMWLVGFRTRKVGDIAGCRRKDTGYVVIKIHGKSYFAHRLAYLYMTGAFPPDTTDHRFGEKDDNRWEMIRPATNGQNRQNIRQATRLNKSGLIGAHWNSAAERWQSSIGINGKRVFLGYFANAVDANRAYLAAKQALHPYQTLVAPDQILIIRRQMLGLKRSEETKQRMSEAAKRRYAAQRRAAC
jgi:hypothetical protein